MGAIADDGDNKCDDGWRDNEDAEDGGKRDKAAIWMLKCSAAAGEEEDAERSFEDNADAADGGDKGILDDDDWILFMNKMMKKSEEMKKKELLVHLINN